MAMSAAIIGALASSGSDYVSSVMGDSPLAFWRLNETSGTVAADLSGNGYNGVYTGGFTLNQAAPGARSGVLLNGTSGYIDIPSFPSLPASAISLEAWISPIDTVTTLGYGGAGAISATVFETHESSTSVTPGFIMSIDNNGTNKRVWWWPEGNKDSFSNNAVPLNAFSHVVLTLTSAGVLNIYVNSVNVLSATGKQYPTGGYTMFKLGAKSWIGGFFKGTMLDLAVYNYALSASQVTSHYNSGL